MEAFNDFLKHNHLPEYNLRIEGENVVFNYKDYQEKTAITAKQDSRPFIKPDTIEKVKRVLGRHFDVYALECCFFLIIFIIKNHVLTFNS
jgi:hypothetical protein